MNDLIGEKKDTTQLMNEVGVFDLSELYIELSLHVHKLQLYMKVHHFSIIYGPLHKDTTQLYLSKRTQVKNKVATYFT